MTFPTAVKKSGPLTISKTGSGSKTLAPGSPKSPGSPQILSGSSKAPLASKAPEKINAGSSVKKPSVPLKSSTIKNVTKPVVNAKLEAEKTLPSAAKGVIKSVTKPPPLNIKVTDAKGLPSPKTPTKSSIKSQMLTKSPLTTKPALVSKSTSVSTGIVRSPSITKSSQVSVTSPMTKSSQVTTGVKSSTTSPLPGKSTLTPKSVAVSSPVTKSPPVVSKTSLTNATVPKSPSGITNPSTLTLKSVASTTNKENLTSLKSKDQATVAKPTTPVKKAAILPVKGSVGVKSPTIPTNKPPVISKSLSTASSLKSSSLKTPTSPLKLLTKEPPSTAKISALKSTNKSSVISKSNPTSSKAIVNKESSSLSLISVKSSSTIKSTTSAVSKTSTLKANVTPLSSSSVTKNLVPKSPVAKTKPLTTVKIPSSPTVKTSVSSIVKTPSSPIVKTSLSIAAKVKTPSPSVKARTSSLSLVKPPLSPAVKKMVPTKLILSPGPSKSKSLSSSRLNSVSTESLASRTSLKSPMTPRSTKVVTKSPSKIIKKTEEPKVKGIRGGQPIKKTIEIPGITELPSNLVSNQQETLQFDFVLENVESVLKEENDSTIPQTPDQDTLDLEKLETDKMVENINDDLEIPNDFVNEESALSNITNDQNVSLSPEVNEHNLETIEEDSIEPSTPSLNEQKQEDICILSDFEVVKKDECVPSLNSISQSVNNCSIAFDDNYFNTKNENVFIKQLDETQSCIIDIDDHFEPMNDKLVLGDVPFETDSSQEDISDNEQTVLKEVVKIENCDAERNDCVDDVFIFTDDLLINNYDSVDSTESFIHQFMPKSIKRSEGSSSISTDDGSLLSRKSYSEAVSGSPKDGEYYFDYDFEIIDDCLDYDDEGRSVFVEVTEKEFPELKPKDLSGKRRRNKKQKKRNYSNRTESQSDSNTEINYNPEDFDGNEFCRYIKMMKDCSFYPNGLFSSDSVKLSTSSSLSWLDISIRTTDDDLAPSTENLSTYEVFQASNLNKEFLTSIIGSNESTPTNETTWFWKSIEGKHQPHNKANITLSLQPRPKHLTTPRFMILLALISEAKGYEIKPSLSENFVTKDCMSRFDEKIRRLMVQGFWLIGRLIKESLSEDEEVNCENPFEFVDGDIGLWWAGINMLDWQEHLNECGTQNKDLPNCYQFVVENMGMSGMTRRNTAEAQLVMNAIPDDFMSELDMENFIHTVRNVKYYSGNCFVDSQENLEVQNEVFEEDDEDLIEWEKNSVEKI